VLEERFLGKVIHYKTVAEANGFGIGVIVVSTDSVLTNLDLTSQVVNALCHRFRAGLAIHSKLEILEGRSLSSEDENIKQRITRGVIAELSRPPKNGLSTSKHFPITEIMSFQDPPSASEMKKTARLLRRCRLEAQEPISASRKDLDNYIQSYPTSCRTDRKRISNIPMMMPRESPIEGYTLDLDHGSSNMPGFLKEIWKAGDRVEQVKVDPVVERKEAMGEIEFEQHRIQKSQCFNVRLSDEDKEEASVTGLWGKSMKMSQKYREHKQLTKLSFHPVNTPTDDIERFIIRDNMKQTHLEWSETISSEIMSLLEEAKSVWNSDEPLSLSIFKHFSRSELITHASLVTKLFTEICYCYKYWIKRADFYKKWCGDIQMLVRCVGDHTFVTYAFPKKFYRSWDTGKIG